MSSWLEANIANRPKVHLTVCVGGIVGSLIVYSILQERIMTEPFGSEGEVFKYSLFLVLANRMLTFAVAVVALYLQRSSFGPVAPAYSYAAVSLSNVIATTCQYEALKHVSFPLQTLGKCAKMIPVMVWGSIISRKVYKAKDYGLAAAITLGCTLFLLSGEVKSKASRSSDSSLWGVLLMGGYLACDGFTSTFQSKLFKGFQMSIYNQIMYTTLFSAAFSLFGLVSSGQFSEAVAFSRRHPQAIVSIFMLSAAATTGQLFIVHTIKAFGPLLFATVMTTRQFVSILLSCLIFAHPLSLGQWSGTALVFSAVLYKAASPKRPPVSETKKNGQEAEKLMEMGGAVPTSQQQERNSLRRNGERAA